MWHTLEILKELPDKLYYLALIITTFIMGSVFLSVMKGALPTDQGRAFAFNGEKSVGKPRGAGIIIISVFVISAFIFVPVKIENIVYYILIFACMLSGFLDDRAEKPWSEYRKGAIDLAIALGAAYAISNYSTVPLALSLGEYTWVMPKAVFVVFGAGLLWVSINATNCSDGIDGFCGTLSVVSMISLGAAGFFMSMGADMLTLIIIMVFSILPYLWVNSEPSRLMMGDAGSRAIGLFIGLLALKTGNMLLYVPFCFVLLCNGMAGIIKVSFIRFLKIHLLRNIRTPIHDHFRKNKKWSNAQTIMRFSITQILISSLIIFWLFF